MPDNVAKKRILIIEESATLRHMLGKSVQKQGCELVSADSFSSAINSIAIGQAAITRYCSWLAKLRTFRRIETPVAHLSTVNHTVRFR